MPGSLASRVLPAAQRRTVDELTEDLDLESGDRESKLSAFWTMLTFSALISTAGVLSDSTATVIGAMIIAPLSTPIMGIALGVAKQRAGASRASMKYVVGGALLVVLIGAVAGLLLPGAFDLLGNSQITSRTSPGLLDLIAAVATGFAGAVALARRDVAAVLPGVAIAISLVPPLSVVGVCIGQSAFGLALGALTLFLSNLVALVLAGTLVFTFVGYGSIVSQKGVTRRKAWLTIGLVGFVVSIALLANTVATIVLSVFSERADTVATQWISSEPGATIQGIDFQSNTLYITVQTPGDLPPTEDLINSLSDELPAGVPVVVVSSIGQRIEAGTTD